MNMAPFVTLGIALALLAAAARAEEPAALTWEQLIPQEGRGAGARTAWGEIAHGQLDPLAPATAAAPIVAALDGRRVRIPGFMVPLDLEAKGIREFLLVPYYGACIHVPPPPANQIVYVVSVEAIEVENPFDAVVVTGRMAATGFATELADAGYRLAAETVAPLQAERWTGGMGGYLQQQASSP